MKQQTITLNAITLGTFVIVALINLGCQSTSLERSQLDSSDSCLILVGHGAPPSDFPREKLSTYFRLHGRVHDHSGGGHDHRQDPLVQAIPDPQERNQFVSLEKELFDWPRNAQNDPYYMGVQDLADRLEKQTGKQVFFAFNEFCGPTVEATVDRALSQGYKDITILTTMMVSGGGHSEHDIRVKVEHAQSHHPGVHIVYAWPYDPDALASVMANQAERF